MKKMIIFSILCMCLRMANGQQLYADDLLDMAGMQQKKMEGYLSKNGYFSAGKELLNDTVVNKYMVRKPKGFTDTTDITTRCMYRTTVNNHFSITYQTSSFIEFKTLASQFKANGFFCYQPVDSLQHMPLLFQHNEVTVRTFCRVEDSTAQYCMEVQKSIFPNKKDMYYADDLMAFTSHEKLAYYFGKNNVQNDIYYFSENEVARCSVLFLNTRRQVVFIWKDEVNKCAIAHLMFGGQQKLQSMLESDRFVAENNWVFKSGIRAGMTLFELRKLNESDFKFYGGGSTNSGFVIAGENGKIDFKTQNVILSCMNCRDDKFSAKPQINADDAIADERILFVLSIILNP